MFVKLLSQRLSLSLCILGPPTPLMSFGMFSYSLEESSQQFSLLNQKCSPDPIQLHPPDAAAASLVVTVSLCFHLPLYQVNVIILSKYLSSCFAIHRDKQGRALHLPEKLSLSPRIKIK